jgi:carboxylate-amine ligase
MSIDFQTSRPDTVGLELELQIVDAETLDLVDGIVPILARFPDRNHVKPEFTQTTVEIVSSPFDAIPPLDRQVRGVFSELATIGRELGMLFAGGGTHPFSVHPAEVTPDPRYHRIKKEAGFLAQDKITFATHVHVGVPDPGTMMQLFRSLSGCLPALVALSANSPYWYGQWSGFAAYRHRALASSRSYGVPPQIPSWSALQRFYREAIRSGMIESMCDLHWDIRPRPTLGTVEIRTMDAQSTIREAVGFAALVRALAHYFRTTPPAERAAGLPSPVPVWFERENHFRATRKGLEASYIDADAEVRPLREVTGRLLEVAGEVTRTLGEHEYFEVVEELFQWPGHQRQRALLEQTGSFAGLVGAMTDILAR